VKNGTILPIFRSWISPGVAYYQHLNRKGRRFIGSLTIPFRKLVLEQLNLQKADLAAANEIDGMIFLFVFFRSINFCLSGVKMCVKEKNVTDCYG